MSGVRIRELAGFAVLVVRSSQVRIEGVQVEDSGSRNERGCHKATGGIQIEEGTAGFAVIECSIRNVLGNGIWTHSLYTSPRNRDGEMAGNRFENIGRDAVQAGHITNLRVKNNSGSPIGHPVERVDSEGGGIPVAIDTAGNVDRSVNAGNKLIRLNLAGCNESGARFGRLYYLNEPDLLRSGIYLGRSAARTAPARNNTIRDNQVSGHGMKTNCLVAGPGVSLKENKVEGNLCSER